MTLRIIAIMAGLFCFPAICVLGQDGFATSDSVGKVNVLKEVEVRGYGADRNLNAPEMGRISLSNKMITDLPVMFGELILSSIADASRSLPGCRRIHGNVCERRRQ